MSFKVATQVFFIGIALLFLSACTATRTSLIDVKAIIEPSSSEKAYNAIILALLDNGFDLKMNDRHLRFTTTEYKKYASVSGFPPFDFYLQIKSLVRETQDGKYEIALSPIIKSKIDSMPEHSPNIR